MVPVRIMGAVRVMLEEEPQENVCVGFFERAGSVRLRFRGLPLEYKFLE